MEVRPLHFIGEQVEVIFEHEPILEKKTGCPEGFIWRGTIFKITLLVAEWHDYRRRGRMGSNMRPEHAATAGRRGSWGVGQDYYRVLTDLGQIFDLYYDRAPKGSDQRKGAWFLHQELEAAQPDSDSST